MALNNILARLTMSELKAIETARGGIAWSGVILLDGRPRYRVSNDGNGGCNFYEPSSIDNYREVRDQLAEIESAAKQATGLKYEALDALTSHMENGDTAAQHVAAVKAERTG